MHKSTGGQCYCLSKVIFSPFPPSCIQGGNIKPDGDIGELQRGSLANVLANILCAMLPLSMDRLGRLAGSLASNSTAELMRGKNMSGDVTIVLHRAQFIELTGRLRHTSKSLTLNLTAELTSDPTSLEDTTLVSRRARIIKLVGRLRHTSESLTFNCTAELVNDTTSLEDTTLVSHQAR
ncbi:hypothetical protein K439DRAFT_1663836 [Ramaria rubella]|nr:hypothetical protein K439DRAFT_1663836 [Ramaria rubella]